MITNPSVVHTTVTLSNAVELTALLAQGILGSNMADTFNGSVLGRQALYDIAATTIRKELNKKVGQ